MFRIGASSLPFLSPIHPKGLDIELARRHTIALLEAAGEVRSGGEPTRECDFSADGAGNHRCMMLCVGHGSEWRVLLEQCSRNNQ